MNRQHSLFRPARIGAVLYLVATPASLLGNFGPAAAQEEAGAANSLAIEIRRQGHPCEGVPRAERDAQQSRPDEPVWIVKCTNATYRIRLIPHQAGRIEAL